MPWTASDTFEYTDWESIRTTLNSLIDQCKTIDLIPQSFTSTISEMINTLAMPYYDEVNKMEDTIQGMYEAMQIEHPGYLPKVTWYARASVEYERNPNYQDWNRWAAFLVLVQTVLTNIIAGFRKCGTFKSGQGVIFP